MIIRQSQAFLYNLGTIVHITVKIAIGFSSCNYAIYINCNYSQIVLKCMQLYLY